MSIRGAIKESPTCLMTVVKRESVAILQYPIGGEAKKKRMDPMKVDD